jgi:hypothetical protein
MDEACMDWFLAHVVMLMDLDASCFSSYMDLLPCLYNYLLLMDLEGYVMDG